MHFVNLCMKFFDKLAYMYIACTALDNAINFITKEMPENRKLKYVIILVSIFCQMYSNIATVTV